jgi:hypothetical protein
MGFVAGLVINPMAFISRVGAGLSPSFKDVIDWLRLLKPPNPVRHFPTEESFDSAKLPRGRKLRRLCCKKIGASWSAVVAFFVTLN